MTISVKDPEKRLRQLENGKRLEPNGSVKLTRAYGEHNTVVRRSVDKLVKSVIKSFFGILMCSRRAIEKLDLKEIAALAYFVEPLQEN